MTPAERDELCQQVARMDGWGLYRPAGNWPCYWLRHGEAMTTDTPDYLGDARLWAPILERLLLEYWYLSWYDSEDKFVMQSEAHEVPDQYMGDTLPEAVLRLFVALKGEV